MSDETKTPPVTPPASNEELTKALARLQEIETKNSELTKQLSAVKDKDLEKNKEWETLAKQRESDLLAERKKNEDMRKSIFDGARYSNVKDECMKQGLRPEAVQDLEFVDMTPVIVEATSTGRVQVNGAADFAAKLKQTRPYWFTDTPPAVNSKGVRVNDSGTGKKVTVQDIQAAETAWRKSGNSEDLKAYNGLVLDFKKQKQLGA
jgi:hypothetical protein